MYIIKDFSEIYGNTAKRQDRRSLFRIEDVSSRRNKNRRRAGYNLPVGDVKVMLVVSDGFPLGYEGIDEDLIETINKINKSGIQLIGMGIGSSSMKK